MGGVEHREGRPARAPSRRVHGLRLHRLHTGRHRRPLPDRPCPRHSRIGIAIGERRGQGLGTAATRRVLDFAFHVRQLRNVLLETLDWNVAGLTANERAGVGIGVRRGAAAAERLAKRRPQKTLIVKATTREEAPTRASRSPIPAIVTTKPAAAGDAERLRVQRGYSPSIGWTAAHGATLPPQNRRRRRAARRPAALGKSRRGRSWTASVGIRPWQSALPRRKRPIAHPAIHAKREEAALNPSGRLKHRAALLPPIKFGFSFDVAEVSGGGLADRTLVAEDRARESGSMPATPTDTFATGRSAPRGAPPRRDHGRRAPWGERAALLR